MERRPIVVDLEDHEPYLALHSVPDVKTDPHGETGLLLIPPTERRNVNAIVKYLENSSVAPYLGGYFLHLALSPHREIEREYMEIELLGSGKKDNIQMVKKILSQKQISIGDILFELEQGSPTSHIGGAAIQARVNLLPKGWGERKEHPIKLNLILEDEFNRALRK